MNYIKLATLEFPRHIGDIWLDHPELEGQFVCPETYAEVEQTPVPEYDIAKQIIDCVIPIQENGVWKTNWKIRNLTQTELDVMAQAQAEFEAQENQGI
jgi:hypothetical protein